MNKQNLKIAAIGFLVALAIFTVAFLLIHWRGLLSFIQNPEFYDKTFGHVSTDYKLVGIK